MAKVKIPTSHFDAAIFDMDGTMIDNAAYHRKAWKQYMSKHGQSLTDDDFKIKIAGRRNDQILPSLFDHQLSENDIATFSSEKEALYRELYRQDIAEVQGLAKLITALGRRHVRSAIATNANAANRDFTVKALGLEGKFDLIVGGEHVKHGKPHPEIYLLAASKLGVPPARCIVFEDSPTGVKAGKEAGMTVVGLLTSQAPGSLAYADYLIRDFTEIEFT